MALLRDGSRRDVERALCPICLPLTQCFQAYLDRFGDRCMNELKLESPTLHDDPLPLMRAVGQLAEADLSAPVASTLGPDPQLQRNLAEKRVVGCAGGKARTPLAL